MPDCNECKYEKTIDEHTKAIQEVSKTIESWRPYMSKMIGILAVLGFLASAALNRVWDTVAGSNSAHATPIAQSTAATTKSELRELIKEAAAEYIKAQAAEVRVSAKTATASSPDANMSNP